MLTQERLKELLIYNPCTGLFKWRVPRQGVRTGPAGCIDKFNGYRRITVDGTSYQASRLAWLYVYGEFPQINDHIDRIRWHDSIWNLANGDTADNMRNSANYIDGRASGRKRHLESKRRYQHIWR